MCRPAAADIAASALAMLGTGPHDADGAVGGTRVPRWEPAFAAALKQIGLADPKVAVEPERSLLASPPIDFTAREEFDFALPEVDGLSFRLPNGSLRHNRDRALVTDMDSLPFVTPVYQRDLRIEDYFIGYLRHPYVSRRRPLPSTDAWRPAWLRYRNRDGTSGSGSLAVAWRLS